MTSTCSSCNIVINEVLAFLQCKIDVMDEKSLIDICATHNSEDEIQAAKRLIFDTSRTSKRCVNRKQDKARKDLQDIISLLKETEPNQLPVFVARQLHKLPPVNFDHVDVSRLLKDIVHLNQEVNKIKILHSEEVTALKSEITSIKACITPTTPRIEIKNTPPQAPKKSTKKSCKKTSTPVSTIISTNSPDQLRSSPVLPPPPSTTPRTLFRVNHLHTAKSTKHSPHDAHTKERKEEEEKGDGFTLVVRKKTWKPKSVNIRGTSNNFTSALKAATTTVAVYASGFDKAVSTQDIEEHLKEIRIPAQKVDLLPEREGVSHNAFKITLNSDNLDNILKHSLWPSGTVIGRFSARAYYTQSRRPKPAPFLNNGT
ncbi:hypothetical protein O0L34_g18586 [Tuta absoluta]|nr:hypothetical protein O0L34_g18586 [Tuta absoluta]